MGDKIGCSDKAIKKAASNNKRCVLVKGSMKIFSISNSTKTISNLSDEIQILIQNIMKHRNFPLHERMKINLDPDTFILVVNWGMACKSIQICKTIQTFSRINF